MQTNILYDFYDAEKFIRDLKERTSEPEPSNFLSLQQSSFGSKISLESPFKIEDNEKLTEGSNFRLSGNGFSFGNPGKIDFFPSISRYPLRENSLGATAVPFSIDPSIRASCLQTSSTDRNSTSFPLYVLDVALDS